MYISQDPIGLAGNNPNFYAYVFDSNIQVDVFGLDCNTIEKVRKLVDKVPDEYKKIFKCIDFAKDLMEKMKKANIEGELIEITAQSNNKLGGRIGSKKRNELIATNGEHQAIIVEDIVFDNMNPLGVEYNKWVDDLEFMPNAIINKNNIKF